ncbi:MAG: VOC family protein [Burkholderiales bacterium]|nr:VOC family protein [Burkholderiales bacterium]
MSRCHIDHITVTAPSLEVGAAFVAQTLGVEPQPGGEHPRMGTHNLLLRLGDTLFLEVISPNPGAPAPQRPRWFGLDRLRADSLPALSTWVARTADIHATAAACAEPLGNIEPMSRGSLDWLITIPADGSIPIDGVAPALIEWHTDVHPASRLQDRGLALVRLEIFHPDPTRVSRLLSSIDLDGPFAVSALTDGVTPYLVAHIDTPWGVRELSVPSLLDRSAAKKAGTS